MNPIPADITRKTGLEAELPRVFTADHALLNNRGAADQHPISAITGLQQALAESKGEPGKSAYEIALEHGFAGSEAEWLESLNGTDWNQNDPAQPGYVKNRTHYSETAVSSIEPFSAEITIDPETGQALLDQAIGLADGGTYTVSWNGAEYECVAAPMTESGVTIGFAIGNIGLMEDGTDTGEPFLIAEALPEFVEGLGTKGLVMAFDGSTAVELSISGSSVTEVVHKIDPKFIPWEAAWQGSPLIVTLNDGLENGTPSLPFETVWKMSPAQIKSIASFVFPTDTLVEGYTFNNEVAVTSIAKKDALLPDGTSAQIITFLIPFVTGASDELSNYHEYVWNSVNPFAVVWNNDDNGRAFIKYETDKDYGGQIYPVSFGWETPSAIVRDYAITLRGEDNNNYLIRIDANGQLYTQRT